MGDDDIEVIRRFNDTDFVFPHHATLQELIEAQMAANADCTSVYCDHDAACGARALTSGQINAKSNQLAHALRRRDIGPGQVVALMTERSFAMIVGILGIIKSGAAYLPIPPDHPSERIRYMLQDCGASLLLLHAPTRDRFDFAGTSIDLDDPDSYDGPATSPANLNRPDDLAYVIYTSGSTGRPKGVMIEHRALVNRLHWMQHAYPLDARDVVLQKTPYFFDVSVWELLWWAMYGANLCFLVPGGERNPIAIMDAVRRHRVSIMHFVPSMLNVFLEYLAGRDADVVKSLASVRRVFASGEALTAAHVQKFNAVLGSRTGAQLTNLYGPTEAAVDVTYFDCPTEGEVRSVPIGRPIHNTRLYVLRDDRQAAIGEIGELCIAGVGLARGYINKPVLTAEKFTENPANPGERIYRTGDIARWRPDGNLDYLGREDHQVKIRGLRIELGEIESTVCQFPGVVDCVALVKKYSESVVLIVAFVVGKTRLDAEDLKAFLRGRLPDYMVPNRFEQLSEMPLTPSGKADRKALLEPLSASA
jgi:amino acid adenylation domain-containing protein